MSRSSRRAEKQRKRIIYLLEELADEPHKEQCRLCGDWYKNLPSHKRHCDK